MKVLVAGASGAIGKLLIAALVVAKHSVAKHSVIGMTTSSAGIQGLSERGADGLVLNALDRQAAAYSYGR
jgi:nucleoside-diphosphate-sugar epimerase